MSPLVPFDRLTISTYSGEQSIGAKLYNGCNGAPSSFATTVWPLANRAIFVPFRIKGRINVAQLFSSNGAAVSGNIDLGIYAIDGTRILSKGSTAQAGTSALQALDVTDKFIAAGSYFFACALDNTTGTLLALASGTLGLTILTGCYQMASAFPLPATATFAALTSDYVPAIGLTQESVL